MLTGNRSNGAKPDLPARPRLGLALSGGGARGLAHIGVLKELERGRIRVDYLAGTSMGGVVAALYASGMSAGEIEAMVLQYAVRRRLLKLVDPSSPRHGVFQGEQLHALFRQHLQDLTFAGLRIPLTLVAVDLNSGQEVHLQEGNVADALRATVSIPGLLAPVERDGQRLVDGALLNNLPADVVRRMGADIVLAVDITAGAGSSFWRRLGHKRFILGQVSGLVGVLGESMDLVVHRLREIRLQQCPPDFLLQPPISQDITVVSGYHRAAELIAAGESVTRQIVPALKDALLLNDEQDA